ncbi:MAG: hypothetical protein ACN2B6_06960 [Rickettsiales bacterium]
MWKKVKETFGFSEDPNDPVETHPALKHFSPTGEYLKSGLRGGLKGALKGALIAGIITAAVLAVGGAVILGGLGAALTAIPVVGWALGPTAAVAGATTGAGLATAGGMSVVASMALLGAKIGGAFGAGKGLINGDEAVAEAEERRIMNYERAQQRKQNEATFAMNMQRQQMAMGGGMAVSPGMIPDMGRGAQDQGIQ